MQACCRPVSSPFTHFDTQGFLPSVLKQGVFPVSMQRARYGVLERLPVLAHISNSSNGSSGGVVNLTEFYLHEAMAQLHIALLGEETDFSEAHNARLRSSFGALLEGPVNHSKDRLVSDFKFVRQFRCAKGTRALCRSNSYMSSFGAAWMSCSMPALAIATQLLQRAAPSLDLSVTCLQLIRVRVVLAVALCLSCH